MKNQKSTVSGQNTQNVGWRSTFANIWSTLTFGTYHREVKERLDRTLQESSELVKESQANLKKVEKAIKKADRVLKEAEEQDAAEFRQ